MFVVWGGWGPSAGERQSFWLEIKKIRRMKDCLTPLCFVGAHCGAEAANSVDLCSRGTKGLVGGPGGPCFKPLDRMPDT